MAEKDFTIDNNLDVLKMKYALEHITLLACSIQGVCDVILENGDKNGDLTVAIENLAERIGWTADGCNGFNVRTSDQWLALYNSPDKLNTEDDHL